MADINATSLNTKTTPDGTDNLVLFNQNTNVGYQIDYDNLADAILNKITSKTFTNQVGGSSAATLLAQLSTLNTNFNPTQFTSVTPTTNTDVVRSVDGDTFVYKFGKVVWFNIVLIVNDAVTSTSTLLSGLPGTKKTINVIGCDTYGVAYRARISGTTFQLWWGKTPENGRTLIFNGFYIAT